MEHEQLRMEVVAEQTREGDKLWRAEIRDATGHLVDSSLPTPNPRAAIADGMDLMRGGAELPDYIPEYRKAQRAFAHVA